MKRPLNDTGWQWTPWPDQEIRARERIRRQQEADTRTNAARDAAEQKAQLDDLRRMQKRQPKRLGLGGDS